MGGYTKQEDPFLGSSTLVLGSITDQLTVTSSPTEKSRMPRAHGGKPGIKGRPLCLTAGCWPYPVSVALSQLLQDSLLKQAGMCVKRLEILRSKPTEAGETLGMGETQYNVIIKPTTAFSSASSLNLEQRDPHNVVSDGLRGSLRKGNLVYTFLSWIFLVFYSCFGMLCIHMAQNLKFKKGTHSKKSLSHLIRGETSMVVSSEPRAWVQVPALLLIHCAITS